jgi:hypothetical protein
MARPAAADPVILAEFIKQAEAQQLPLDFVSYHQYGNPRQCGAGWTSDYAMGGAGTGVSKTGYFWEPSCFQTLFEWAQTQVPEKYPVRGAASASSSGRGHRHSDDHHLGVPTAS